MERDKLGKRLDSAGQVLLVRAKKFMVSDHGTTAILFALLLPVLLLIVGGTIDFASILTQRSVLQSAADAAAMSGAKGLSLSDARRENVSAIVEGVVNSFVRSNLEGQGGATDISIETAVRDDPLEVEVFVKQTAKSFFGPVFGLDVDRISVTATARVIGQPNICVLGLNEVDGGTVSLETNSRLTGRNCAVFSNSSHTDSIKSRENSFLKAGFICSHGGREGGDGNFDPQPTIDCPGFDDPLASRPEPQPEACISREPMVVEGSRQLSPGTYCGGLTVKGMARVELRPGIYVMKDGPLIVSDTAELAGEEVGIFFTGSGANMVFDRNTTISLSAPASGLMAGLLIFSSRSMPNEIFKILSDNARVLLGTIYLPNGELLVETEQPVADRSAYTVVVADTLHLIGQPHLVLNTDYHLTSVPVPDGIKGAGQPVSLVK